MARASSAEILERRRQELAALEAKEAAKAAAAEAKASEKNAAKRTRLEKQRTSLTEKIDELTAKRDTIETELNDLGQPAEDSQPELPLENGTVTEPEGD